jgi:predicted transcriptional regulator
MKGNIPPKPDWQKLVGDDTKKAKEQKRKRIHEIIKSTHKLPEFPKKIINMKKHFYLKKDISGLSKEALCVYPVLCSVADFINDDWFHIQKEDIERRTGISQSAISKGLNDLENKGIVQRELITSGKTHYYRYKVQFIRKELIDENKSDFFIFHTCIIDSGVWKKLPVRAKALYLAMRSKATFIKEVYYADAFDEYLDHDEIQAIYDDYSNREFDVCAAALTDLCRLADIQRVNIDNALEALSKHRLIEKQGIGEYYVYLKPDIEDHKKRET